MKASLACLPVLSSCTTAFVLHSPSAVVGYSASASARTPAPRTGRLVVVPTCTGRSGDPALTSPSPRATGTPLQARRRAREEEEEEVQIYSELWGEDMVMVIGKDQISYVAVEGYRNPAVLYLPAFDAPNTDVKSDRLKRYCAEQNYSFFSMEWYGGSSHGAFKYGTISRWKQDAITLIDKLLPEPYQEVIIVGGGAGGWIATLIALERPEKVAGIVGLAADPDFTHNLLMRYLPERKTKEIMGGLGIITWGDRTYPVSKQLIDDATENLVLQGPVGGLPITCPIRLVHGLNDEEVPYTVSLDLARRVESLDVQCVIVKTGTHHLDSDVALKLLVESVEECIANYVPHFRKPTPPPRDSI